MSLQTQVQNDLSAMDAARRAARKQRRLDLERQRNEREALMYACHDRDEETSDQTSGE